MPRFVKLAATLLGAWFCLGPLSAQAGILITIDKATQQIGGADGAGAHRRDPSNGATGGVLHGH